MAKLKDTQVDGNLSFTGELLNKDGVNLETAFSNPNLLINSDFRNPINQRGHTRYTRGSSDTYTIDRWVLNYATVLDVLDGCVQLTGGSANNCYWLQYFETHLSGTFTVSFNVLEVTGDMKFHILDGATPHNVLTIVPGINTATFTVSDLVRIGFCALKTGAVAKIEWIKLEQGSIATPLVPRPIGEELALCQRYYQKYNGLHNVACANKYIDSDTIEVCIPLVASLRTSPTIEKFYSVYISEGTHYGSWRTITGIAVDCTGNNIVTLTLTSSATLKAGMNYYLIMPNYGYITLDAEMY